MGVLTLSGTESCGNVSFVRSILAPATTNASCSVNKSSVYRTLVKRLQCPSFLGTTFMNRDERGSEGKHLIVPDSYGSMTMLERSFATELLNISLVLSFIGKRDQPRNEDITSLIVDVAGFQSIGIVS